MTSGLTLSLDSSMKTSLTPLERVQDSSPAPGCRGLHSRDCPPAQSVSSQGWERKAAAQRRSANAWERKLSLLVGCHYYKRKITGQLGIRTTILMCRLLSHGQAVVLKDIKVLLTHAHDSVTGKLAALGGRKHIFLLFICHISNTLLLNARWISL